MLLITESVWTRLGGRNDSHYGKIGYHIPRKRNKQGRMLVARGTKILVRVEDLPKGSEIKVEFKCNNCGEHQWTMYRDYLKNRTGLCIRCSGIKNGKANKGRHPSKETMRRIKENHADFSGENHLNWKGGLKTLQATIRTSFEGKEWIQHVFKKYDYTCQKCKQRIEVAGSLNAHHIINLAQTIDMYGVTKDNWQAFKLILFNIENGICFCKDCHKEFHGYCDGPDKPVSRKQLNRFLRAA